MHEGCPNTCVVAGAVAVGYALASIYKANEIRKSDCDTLKSEYSKSSNLTMGLVALGRVIFVVAGIVGGQQ